MIIKVEIDELLEKSNLSVSNLMSILLGLDMRELVRELPGKHFVRKV